jgi:hypothetical protein
LTRFEEVLAAITIIATIRDIGIITKRDFPFENLIFL